MRARSVSIVHDDPHAAGRDVALELVEALGAKPDLVMLFMPTELYDHQAVIAALRAAIGPGARIAGCTSMAEIGQVGALTGSVTAMGMCLDKVGVEVVMTPVTYLVVGWLKRAENEDYYDRDTDFTPFSLED